MPWPFCRRGDSDPHLILAIKVGWGHRRVRLVGASTWKVASVHVPHPRDRLKLSAVHHAFMFDLDGTLIDIAPSPEAVVVSAALPALLAAVGARAGGAIAIVSGRPVDDIDRLLPGLGIAIAGEHGACIRLPEADEATFVPATPIGLAALRTACGRVNEWSRQHRGVIVERKARSVALHYRMRPDLAEAARALASGLARSEAPALIHQPGKMVEELRVAGPDKGSALRALMSEPAFRGRSPLFFGDDLADEPAFTAAAALGGVGIIVGPPFGRSTAATAALASPSAVMHCLEAALCR